MWIIDAFVSRSVAAQLARPVSGAAAGMPSLLLCVLFTASPAFAQEAAFPAGFSSIDREVQALKQEILDINQELLQLEEDLLYPAEQQLQVFLTLGADTRVTVQHLRIALNGETIVDHSYVGAEVDALQRGGVHKPYVGRIDYGEHRLAAEVIGYRSDGKPFRQRSESRFAKGQGGRYIELRIAATGGRGSPELTIHTRQQ